MSIDEQLNEILETLPEIVIQETTTIEGVFKNRSNFDYLIGIVKNKADPNIEYFENMLYGISYLSYVTRTTLAKALLGFVSE